MMLRDVVQRIYSDDGHGDGTITLAGLRGMTRMNGMPVGSEEEIVSGKTASLLMPVAVAAMASRRELIEQAERFYAVAEQDIRRPYWEKIRTPSASLGLLGQWECSLREKVRLAPLCLLVPALDRASGNCDCAKAAHEAVLVVLVLEEYREKQGRYPESLGELVPRYLPTMPLDYSTGGPLRYKLKDGKPLLYGLGLDGKDDGGVRGDEKDRYRVPEKGDWVLYPPGDGR